MTQAKTPDDLTRRRQAAQMAEVCKALEMGAFLETAATYAGLHPATLDRWLARGRKETSGFFFDFVQAADKATAKAEIFAVAGVFKAGRFEWWLERRCGLRWRLPKDEKPANAAPAEDEVALSWSALSVADRRALLEILGRATVAKDTAQTG